VKLGPYELGPTDDPNQGIYTGDARVLTEAIPDESVDLIFTDPVYDRIDDYRWLAETAARVLKPDRACLVWYGIGFLDETMRVLCEHLSYRWQLILFYNNLVRTPHVDAGWSKYAGCLWYENGHMKARKGIDLLSVPVFGDLESTGGLVNHGWSKPIRFFEFWIPRFVKNDDIVFDPFTGGGTVPAVCKMLGHHWLAFEIDPATADTARERVRNTQPPLFVLQPEQLTLETT
jgi:DNA modification methylase